MQDQINRFEIAVKYLKKAAGNCYLQFPDINQTRVELSYPQIGEEAIIREEQIYSR